MNAMRRHLLIVLSVLSLAVLDQRPSEAWPCTAMHATEASAVAAVRSAVVADIWKGAGLPTRVADAVAVAVDPAGLSPSAALGNVASVDRYTVITNGNTVQPWLLHPLVAADRLAIVVMGHLASDSLSGSAPDTALVQESLTRGNAVLLVPMPSGGPSGHNTLGTHATSTFHPVAYFLDPTIVALNQYLSDHPAPSAIVATGISGGGWTTALVAALDTRIQASVPIAGSLPLEVRDTQNANDVGDWEQQLPGLTYNGTDALGYLDVYLLGASGGRRQIQVNNEFDPCCFYGRRHEPYAALLTYQNPNWSFSLDSSHSTHGVGATVLSTILGPLLGAPVSQSSGGGDGNVSVRDTTLTHSQIAALASTPQTIVEAPGPGLAAVLLAVVFVHDYTAGAYSDTSVRVRYAGHGADLVSAFSNTLNQTAKRLTQLPILASGLTPASGIANTAITVSTATNPTGGNAVNTMRIRAIYTIVPVP